MKRLDHNDGFDALPDEVLSHSEWLRIKLANSISDTRPRIAHWQMMDELQELIARKRQAHADQTKD